MNKLCMSWVARLTMPLMLLIALSGCADQKERFVLLPQADGSASSIVIKTAAGQTPLTTPYAAIETQAGKFAKVMTLSAAEVQQRYAPVMGNLPLRPRIYVLQFELGRDRLTLESRKFLDQAMDEIQQFPAGEFVVTGHADNIGNQAFNQILSLRRAQLIETELRNASIHFVSIEVAGKGAQEPRVPAKKGVPEPRNRYVEIKLR